MGSSGLILVVIVAAWALFLVPQWLQRRSASLDPVELAGAESGDALSPEEHSARGSAAVLVRAPVAASEPGWIMRTLGRLRAVLPARERWSTPPSGGSGGPGPSPAARRRRILAGLLAATLLSAAGVGLAQQLGAQVSWLLVGVPAGLLVGYVVLLAVVRPGMTARRPAAGLRRAGPREAETWADGEVSDGAAEEPQADPAGTTDHQPDRVRGPAAAKTRPTAEGDVEPNAVQAVAESEEPGAWTPRPVPLPSYVTAPRAPRRIRSIDLSAPGSWTAERSPAMPSQPGGDGASVAATGEAVEDRPRVVGE